MNKRYHTIWNQMTQSWVAVSEHSRSQGKMNSILSSKGVRLLVSSVLGGLVLNTNVVLALNVSTTADGEHAVVITSDSPIFISPDSQISTTGAGAYGVYVNLAAADVGAESIINTMGTSSHGVSVENTSIFTMPSGSITTAGDESQGIHWRNSTGANIYLDTGVNITTNGNLANGIDLQANSGLVSLTSNGLMDTTGTALAVASGNGYVVVVSNGRIQSDSYGITAGVVSGNAMVTSNNDIIAGVGGILVNLKSTSANSKATVVSNGNITSQGVGIEVNLSDAGEVNITTVAGKLINTDEDGILVSAQFSTTPAIISNASDIMSANNDVIDVAQADGGTVIHNSGNLTVISRGYVIVGGVAVDKVTNTAGILTGNTYLGSNNDEFTASGGALVGSVWMGSGDDVITVSGTVYLVQTPQFDGGEDADSLNIDGLSVRGFTASSNDSSGNDISFGTNLTGFETINVNNAGTLKLSKDLFTTSTTGDLNIDATSTLDLKGSSSGVFSIFGNVNNSGIMTQADGAADDITTIAGNYTGVAGSQYHIDTVFGDDSSATDKLVINGDSEGTTELVVTNAGGTGAQTVEGIQVVQVDGVSGGVFTLAAPVQVGSYEYTLFKNGVSTPADGDWYLRSTIVIPPVIIDPSEPIYLYRPAIATYVVAQTANAESGFSLLSSLHERMGEQKNITTDQAQTWGRVFLGLEDNQGATRFGYEQNTSGFQFGRDLLHTTNSKGTQQRAGLTAQYANGKVDVTDSIRPLAGLGLDTGTIRSAHAGLGGYYTNISQNGMYVDVVGQVNSLKNKFSDSYGGQSKQSALQAGLSTEIGKPFAFGKGFQIEPQAQLSYLYTDYSDFSDAFSRIDGDNVSSLRARLGARLTKDVLSNGKNAQYYAIANINYDVMGSQSTVANDLYNKDGVVLSEEFDKTSAELGLGVQGKVGKSTYLYADARYERSFKGNRDSSKFNVGLKSHF